MFTNTDHFYDEKDRTHNKLLITMVLFIEKLVILPSNDLSCKTERINQQICKTRLCKILETDPQFVEFIKFYLVFLTLDDRRGLL